MTIGFIASTLEEQERARRINCPLRCREKTMGKVLTKMRLLSMLLEKNQYIKFYQKIKHSS